MFKVSPLSIKAITFQRKILQLEAVYPLQYISPCLFSSIPCYQLFLNDCPICKNRLGISLANDAVKPSLSNSCLLMLANLQLLK